MPCEHQCAHCRSTGGAAHAGLLEMETKAGGYGTVCGMNGVAADVACRQMGFDFWGWCRRLDVLPMVVVACVAQVVHR